jgi:alginate O-acetyltransferase complex protein AlgI
MTFTSLSFLFFFLTTFALYYGASFSGVLQLAVLVLASAIFYAWDNPRLLGLLISVGILSGLASFAIDRIAAKRERLAITAVCIALMLGVLGFFKYGGLFYSTLIGAGHQPQWEKFFLGIPLPIGISFYIFHAISLLVDIYRRQYRLEAHTRPGSHLLRTGLYIVFFPQLIAGPITKARNFYPQIMQKHFSGIDWSFAFHCLLLGYFMKLVVADNLAVETQAMSFPDFLHTPGILLGALLLGYSCQIFSDFFGYSLMAMGLAALFGYRLPENFNRPYIAASFSEFWQRWHMSLSAWLRDYLYIPLGGSRKGRLRTYLNLFIVMFLGGLWHGAAWSFAIWGSVHGLALAIERLVTNGKTHGAPPYWVRGLRIALVFSVVTIAWLFFRLANYDQAFSYLWHMVSNLLAPVPRSRFFTILIYCLPVLAFHAMPLAGDFFARKGVRHTLYALMLFFIISNAGVPGAFIYFRF